MYDQERMLDVARSQTMASANAVQCSLDFSKGPDAMMIATMGPTTYFTPAAGNAESFTALEANSKPAVPDQEPQYSVAETNVEPTTQLPPHSSIINDDTFTNKPRAICSFCNKSFTHLGDYNKHRRRHTGERPYSCDLCPLRFGHASNLARHRRLHSGEKPFACGTCGKKFSRKDKLGVHVARKCCEKTDVERK